MNKILKMSCLTSSIRSGEAVIFVVERADEVCDFVRCCFQVKESKMNQEVTQKK